MLAGIGMRAPPKPVLGGATGYAHKGGGFQRVLTHLSGAGLIEYRNGGVALTDAGEAIAPAPSGGTIRERLRTLTQPAHEKIIEALVENNGFLTKQDLAQATNYEAKGGGFQRVLTHLSGLKVITYESGGVVLAPWVTA